MDRWKDRVALVTGASGSIGLAIARTLAMHGMQVVICGRNFEKLKEVAEELNQYGSGSVYGCDITQEDEILAMFEKVNDKYGGVDVMINAAGLANGAALTTGKTSDWKRMIDVNILGAAICSREAINSMKRFDADDGHIININGLSGHRVEQNASTHFYAATKFALTAMTEGLRQELRDKRSHIKVSQISPGVVQNEFLGGRTPLESNSYKAIEGQDVADIVRSILSTPPHVQIHDVLVRPLDQSH
ncbi:dehydrogenase/reductase SDR family member 11-like [Lineus longissimus]|uniref:dehydrogenase/reductase SDR family member 11-like n=1 Tax=Lineus longissimus TaxID=88925 RepID=UPI002B4E4265